MKALFRSFVDIKPRPMATKKSSAKPTLTRLVGQLGKIVRSWDAASVQLQKQLLKSIGKLALDKASNVTALHDSLLFLLAYPADAEVLALAEGEMRRLTRHVASRTRGKTHPDEFHNSGIAGSDACSIFSLSMTQWLADEFGSAVTLYTDDFQTEKLMQLLNTSLDPVEQEMMHSEKMEWEWYSQTMSGIAWDRHALLKWILSRLEATGVSGLRAAEYLFSELEIFVNWRMQEDGPSLSRTRIRQVEPFFHPTGILKRIQLQDALAQGRPRQIALTLDAQRELVKQSRGALGSLLRETDPLTYAAVEETELFDMGRGVSVALFYMDRKHKMALQSYVGYLLFKNGVPCAYGGGWVVNKEAGFGVNIFPPFRGGESANIVCQLLRLYALHFGLSSFTVDPYQIGYGNPDGIASGAFWFYYRLGFRAMEEDLAKLSEKEFAKMAKDSQYRSSEATLLKLAGSTLRWTDGKAAAPFFTPDLMGDLVSTHVGKHFGGSREAATAHAMKLLHKATGLRNAPLLQPILLLALATGYLDRTEGSRLQQFAETYSLKSSNESAYLREAQQFQDFFEGLSKAQKKMRV
jgi:hypothetical protein